VSANYICSRVANVGNIELARNDSIGDWVICPSQWFYDEVSDPQSRSMSRYELVSSDSYCFGNLASLTNTDDNQSSSHDGEDNGKGGNHRISDFELAPKLMAPFIIFFFWLGITVCGIFLGIKANLCRNWH
jgi:hypothetical protein